MEKNSVGLLAYVRSVIGTPYVYGTKMELLTIEKFNSLQSTYGKSLVWDSDADKIGKVCCDCSGLISSYTGIVRSSSGYKDSAISTAPISTIKDAPLGALVWMNGHIGVYSGMKDGTPYYIAADGSAYNCRESTLSNNKFTHWFLCADIKYIEEGGEEMRYNSVAEMPSWAQPTIQKLTKQGILNGNDGSGNTLDLSLDMIRLLVINDRAGLYK